jgi:magnesium chelatase subunit I
MTEENAEQPSESLNIKDDDSLPKVSSLHELINLVTGRNLSATKSREDAGIADVIPFPFLALVGQDDMKLALLLALINPAIGGVLLIGPRGTGKTTAVRSLVDLLPEVSRSLCYYGCLPDEVEMMGMDGICPACAKKYAEGEPLAVFDKARLVELPLNARLEDVIGGADERAAMLERYALRRGILAQADRNLLYVDEVNLLNDDVIDAILDAAAQGHYVVRRGPVSATFRSRFVLIGSMNPEEGRLRPQIMDRFGLRVTVRGLQERDERMKAYQYVHAYNLNPHAMAAQFENATAVAQQEIQIARDVLPQVILPATIAQLGLTLIERLDIDSLRAEITLFEAARAHAVADGRLEVEETDLVRVAPLALRLRRSEFMSEFFSAQSIEEQHMQDLLDEIFLHPDNAEAE